MVKMEQGHVAWSLSGDIFLTRQEFSMEHVSSHIQSSMKIYKVVWRLDNEKKKCCTQGVLPKTTKIMILSHILELENVT